MIACVISPQLDRLEKIPQVEAEPAGSDHGYDSTEKRPDTTRDGIVPDLPTRIEEKEDDRSRNKDLVGGHNRHSAPLTYEVVRRLYYISPCTASFAGKARYLQAGRRPRWALPLGAYREGRTAAPHQTLARTVRSGVDCHLYSAPHNTKAHSGRGPGFHDLRAGSWSRLAPLRGQSSRLRPMTWSRIRRAALMPYMRANSGAAAIPNLLCTPVGVRS